MRGTNTKRLTVLTFVSFFVVQCSHQSPNQEMLESLYLNQQRMLAGRRDNIVPSKVNGRNIKTSYSGLEALFADADIPPLDSFRSDQSLGGRCVFKAQPQNRYPDVANTFIERDALLGPLIHFVPGMKGLPTPERKPMNSVTARQKAKAEIHHYSLLQYEMPKGMALALLEEPALGRSAYLSYSKNSTENQVNFRLRTTPVEGRAKKILILEHNCPHLGGCEFPNSGERYQYLEPYAYCYYLNETHSTVPIDYFESALPVPAKSNIEQDLF